MEVWLIVKIWLVFLLLIILLVFFVNLSPNLASSPFKFSTIFSVFKIWLLWLSTRFSTEFLIQLFSPSPCFDKFSRKLKAFSLAFFKSSSCPNNVYNFAPLSVISCAWAFICFTFCSFILRLRSMLVFSLVSHIFCALCNLCAILSNSWTAYPSAC